MWGTYIFYIICHPHLKNASEKEHQSINKENHLKPLIASLRVNSVLKEEDKNKKDIKRIK